MHTIVDHHLFDLHGDFDMFARQPIDKDAFDVLLQEAGNALDETIDVFQRKALTITGKQALISPLVGHRRVRERPVRPEKMDEAQRDALTIIEAFGYGHVRRIHATTSLQVMTPHVITSTKRAQLEELLGRCKIIGRGHMLRCLRRMMQPDDVLLGQDADALVIATREARCISQAYSQPER